MFQKMLLVTIASAIMSIKESPAQIFAVIVNKSNPVNSLSKDEVSKLFLKKTTQWDDGQNVMPVDLAVSSSTRKVFSETLLGKTASAVKSYWQQQAFSGRGKPPAQRDDENAVLKYVQDNPGAIGYISPDADFTTYNVKIVDVN